MRTVRRLWCSMRRPDRMRSAQAREFSECADITGIILTKMDGTAKGGIAVAIHSELGIPVKYIGVGGDDRGSAEVRFNQFVNALFEVGEEKSGC